MRAIRWMFPLFMAVLVSGCVPIALNALGAPSAAPVVDEAAPVTEAAPATEAPTPTETTSAKTAVRGEVVFLPPEKPPFGANSEFKTDFDKHIIP